MSITMLGQVAPILMCGESHTLAFRDILFKPDWSDQSFLCRSLFMPKAPASVMSVGAALSVEVVDIFKAQGLIDVHMRATHLWNDPSAAFISGQPQLAPAMVFFGGDTELVYLIGKIGLEYDFELPDDAHYGVDRSKKPMPYSTVAREVEKITTPFINAMRQLRAAGFNRLMVHCIPPRSRDEYNASAFYGGVQVPASVRSKLVVLANRQLRAACASAGIPFIDVWDELADEAGLLRPEFDLDGLHVNRRAVPASLRRIAEQLYEATADNANRMRYERLFEQAEAGPQGRDGAGGWPEGGMASASVDSASLAQAIRDCQFAAADQHPQARIDWCGWPRSGRSGVQTAALSVNQLEMIRDCLSQAAAQACLHTASPAALTVISCRPVRFKGAVSLGGPASAGVPPGVRRAVLVLRGGGHCRLGDGAPQAVAPGQLLVHDGARACQFEAEAETDVLELVLMPRLADTPFRVVAAGLAEWPADPYAYALEGMLAAPPVSGQRVLVRAR